MVSISFFRTHTMYNQCTFVDKKATGSVSHQSYGIQVLLLLALFFPYFLYMFQISLYHFVSPINLEKSIDFLLFLAIIVFYHPFGHGDYCYVGFLSDSFYLLCEIFTLWMLLVDSHEYFSIKCNMKFQMSLFISKSRLRHILVEKQNFHINEGIRFKQLHSSFSGHRISCPCTHE